MSDNPGVYLGGPTPQYLLLNRANRHGLITGATGTGKTVSLQVLAEGFSRAGVPVFAADIKGDLSGLSQPGSAKPFITERVKALGLADFGYQGSPAVYWDIFGKSGHPLRTTISEMGPLLLARLLDLTDAQEGVLNIVFKIADEDGLLLLDLKDLQAMLTHVAENADQLTTRYGNVAKATVGAIQRNLLTLENQGGASLFGEPALQLTDFIRTDATGRGFINVLAADQLIERPQLYATFLLWLLSELFEDLPEIGDPEKPRLVFFFDEAHLLFNDAPKALLDKVAQVVRLIRSKGVGVYLVTQNPMDVPVDVLAQLGNRVHHALRAFTPKDQKAVRVAAETLRPNPAFDTAETIGALGVGEALVSLLDEKGAPCMVQRTLIAPPHSRVGTITPDERQGVIKASPLFGKYEAAVDRDSAYERLTQRQAAPPPPTAPAREQRDPAPRPPPAPRPAPMPRPSNRQSVGEAFAKSVVRTIGSQVGREIIRGVLGSILRR
jgi:hypothetical protein